MNRGFTLIETLIYIALLGLLMTTAVLAAYQILQGSAEVSTQAVVQDEGNFVLRKINWALNNGFELSDSTNLTIDRTGSPSQVDFCLRDGRVWMVETGGGNISCNDSAFLPITTENVDVQSFVYSVDNTATPKWAMATVTLKTANGTDEPQSFAITKYLRQ